MDEQIQTKCLPFFELEENQSVMKELFTFILDLWAF